MMSSAQEENETRTAGVAMPGNSVGFSLSQVGLETSRQFGDVVAAIGLEPRHFAVLYAVQRSTGQLQQTIGDRLAIPPSTMVAIVDHLEGEGLLERRPLATDRRARTLFLTGRGEALLVEALARARDQEERICAGFRARRTRSTPRAVVPGIAQSWSVVVGAARSWEWRAPSRTLTLARPRSDFLCLEPNWTVRTLLSTVNPDDAQVSWRGEYVTYPHLRRPGAQHRRRRRREH